MYGSARTAEDLNQEVTEGDHLQFLSAEGENEVGCYCRYWGRPSHRCSRCWKRWAYHRKRKLAAQFKEVMAPAMVWHHAVLHFRFHPARKTRSTMLSSLRDSLKRRHKDAQYAWVWHQTPLEVHCHLLVGTADEIDADWLANRWSRIMKKYGRVEYSPRDLYCKPRDHPLAVLGYILGVNTNHQKKTKPWGGLVGKITDNNLPRRKKPKASAAGSTP